MMLGNSSNNATAIMLDPATAATINNTQANSLHADIGFITFVMADIAATSDSYVHS